MINKDINRKDERFQIVLSEGSSLSVRGLHQILVDKETGVSYLLFTNGSGGVAITPLLGADGKPQISSLYDETVNLNKGF